jgi:hypothetical protein
MVHPRLVILGYSEAAMFLRGTSEADVAAIISIQGKREFGVEAEVPRRLDLVFDDIEVPRAGDVVGRQRTVSRRRWAELNGLIEVAPAAADVEAIVRFAEEVRGVGGGSAIAGVG